VTITEIELQIKREIRDYIDGVGGPYKSWYVGISADPGYRLFNQHGVIKENDYWIYRPAPNAEVARSIEDYFVNVLGTDGGPGGGDEDAKHVYAYKKNSHTNP
jgi:hypothetical protein